MSYKRSLRACRLYSNETKEKTKIINEAVSWDFQFLFAWSETSQGLLSQCFFSISVSMSSSSWKQALWSHVKTHQEYTKLAFSFWTFKRVRVDFLQNYLQLPKDPHWPSPPGFRLASNVYFSHSATDSLFLSSLCLLDSLQQRKLGA